MRIAWLIYQGAEQPLVLVTFSPPLSLSIYFMHPVVSYHSLSVTLHLICKLNKLVRTEEYFLCIAVCFL